MVSDAEALAECMHAAYMIYTSRLDGKTLPPMTVDYEEEIRSYPVWVAESDGTLVGGLILMPEDDCMTIAIPMREEKEFDEAIFRVRYGR